MPHNDFLSCEKELTVENKISKLKIVEDKAKLMVANEYEFRELLFASEETEEAIGKEINASEIYIDKWRVLEMSYRVLSIRKMNILRLLLSLEL